MSDNNKTQVETIKGLRDKYLAVEKKKNKLEKQIFWLNASLRTKKQTEFKKTLSHLDSAGIEPETETLQSVLLVESEKLAANLNEVKKELALKDAKIQVLEAKIVSLEKRGAEKPEKLVKSIGKAQNSQHFNETPKEMMVTDDTIEKQEAQIQALETKIKALEKDRTDRQKNQLMGTTEEERDIARQNEELAKRLRKMGVEKRKLLHQINDLMQGEEKGEEEKEDKVKKKRLRSFDLLDDDVRNEPFIKASFK